ncbi:hypothetical protein LINPERHAP1_LOCUS26903 [Linum perenne]
MVNVLKKIWLDADELVKHPSTVYCFEAVSDDDELVAAYGSASCSEEGISDGDCRDRLYDALKIIDDACGSVYGARITTTTCFLRYESYQYC